MTLLAFAAQAMAAPFSTRMREANALLLQGAPDKAIEAYRELQTERPESAEVPYNMGSAAYIDGVAKTEGKQFDEALDSLQEARAAFERTVQMADGDLRVQARYNAANTLLQRAKTLEASAQIEEATQAYEEAVRDFEEMVSIYPDHDAARHNLAHARLLWKKMLKQEPISPEEEQQEKQEQEKDEEEQAQPVASVARAETDLPQATVQTSAGENSATVRLVEPDTEGQQ
jgi:tetratricopeptide (TPR) repeat protein